MRRSLRYISLLLLLIGPVPASAALPSAEPTTLGFDAARLQRLDAAVEESIKNGEVPGAVLLVGRHGKIAYAKAFGQRVVGVHPEPMTRDTVFDMASITKPVATATSIMILMERGQLRLDDRLATLLPEFDNHGKGGITVEQLLRHRAGFIADNPIGDFQAGVEEAWKRLANLDLKYRPGTSYIYSDVGFMSLGRIVERLSGKPLDHFASEEIFGPLGMSDSHFRRPVGGAGSTVSPRRIAPTEPDSPGGTMLRGIVHDPRSRALEGVAGHAGLFSTADDLAIYAQMILDGGVGPNGRRVLSPLTIAQMVDPGDTPSGERRGLGWDVTTSQSVSRGGLFGYEGFGHTGFTGTSLWVDRPTRTFVILLTSRLHPDGKKPAPSRLRHRVATIVAAAITDADPSVHRAVADSGRPSLTLRRTVENQVACGIDVLAAQKFAPLRGKRVGLVTNHTGRTLEGTPTIDALFKAEGVKLVALFSPEHGIRGLVDAEVSDSRDDATGLPIFSLYGKTRKPTAESLKDVELLVYDIQDIGTRFYTYISTMGLVLEAAKERGIPVYVLDRPNPIGGNEVAGPVRDEGFETFIAHHDLPVRHGMTVAELAQMFNAERMIGADLHVVPCEGWSRGDFYDRTGLPWVNPSPNMRSLTEALLYPGIGLLEASNLATGRGTDTPFERFGAPWINAVQFARGLNDLGLPGVRFLPVRFTPKERQYAGQECQGAYAMIVDRDRFEPIRTGFGVAHVLRTLYREQWKPEGFLRMLADRKAYQAVLDGSTPTEVEKLWQPELDAFLARRKAYLIYR